MKNNIGYIPKKGDRMNCSGYLLEYDGFKWITLN